MSVIFSSFYHQCPIALYVCSVSKALGVSADKKETVSFLQSLPASFSQIFISSMFSKGLVSNR